MAFTNESRERLRLPTGETGQLLRELIGASDQGIRTDVRSASRSAGTSAAGIGRAPSRPT